MLDSQKSIDVNEEIIKLERTVTFILEKSNSKDKEQGDFVNKMKKNDFIFEKINNIIDRNDEENFIKNDYEKKKKIGIENNNVKFSENNFEKKEKYTEKCFENNNFSSFTNIKNKEINNRSSTLKNSLPNNNSTSFRDLFKDQDKFMIKSNLIFNNKFLYMIKVKLIPIKILIKLKKFNFFITKSKSFVYN